MKDYLLRGFKLQCSNSQDSGLLQWTLDFSITNTSISKVDGKCLRLDEICTYLLKLYQIMQIFHHLRCAYSIKTLWPPPSSANRDGLASSSFG